jgi:hypothetical protein
MANRQNWLSTSLHSALRAATWRRERPTPGRSRGRRLKRLRGPVVWPVASPITVLVPERTDAQWSEPDSQLGK